MIMPIYGLDPDVSIKERKKPSLFSFFTFHYTNTTTSHLFLHTNCNEFSRIQICMYYHIYVKFLKFLQQRSGSKHSTHIPETIKKKRSNMNSLSKLNKLKSSKINNEKMQKIIQVFSEILGLIIC